VRANISKRQSSEEAAPASTTDKRNDSNVPWDIVRGAKEEGKLLDSCDIKKKNKQGGSPAVFGLVFLRQKEREAPSTVNSSSFGKGNRGRGEQREDRVRVTCVGGREKITSRVQRTWGGRGGASSQKQQHLGRIEY